MDVDRKAIESKLAEIRDEAASESEKFQRTLADAEASREVNSASSHIAIMTAVFARTNLGAAYAEGEGTDKNDERAFYWRKSVAELVDQLPAATKSGLEGGGALLYKAMHFVGKAYKDGLGVSEDHAKAVEWLEKASGRFGRWSLQLSPGPAHPHSRRLRSALGNPRSASPFTTPPLTATTGIRRWTGVRKALRSTTRTPRPCSP